jgi:hypothetical protein
VQTPSPGTLALSTAAITVGEAEGSATVTIERTGGASGAVSVTAATAAGSATAAQDFVALSTVVTFADGDAAPKTVSVGIVQDGEVEGSESFTVAISAPAGGATLGTPSSLLVTISDDDSSPPAPGFGLDDTGVTTCATADANGLPCGSAADGTAAFPGQDAEVGRDASTADPSDGRAGFSFRKLGADGAPVANPAADYATSPWACLEDLVTGLTWEVRPDDGGLRDRHGRYSWYDASGFSASREAGLRNGGVCTGGVSCDTEGYAAAVNTAKLCGKGDWRLPTRAELLSIVDYGAPALPLLDGARFPDGVAGAWWTSSSTAEGWAWTVDFATGESHPERPTAALPVRLVRGGY